MLSEGEKQGKQRQLIKEKGLEEETLQALR